MKKPQAIECEGGYYYVGDGVVIDPTAEVGAGTYLWDGARVFAGAKIGSQCVIGAHVAIENDVLLGNGCKVQAGNNLYKGVQAGDFVFFGPNLTTTNDRNPRAFGGWDLAITRIETGASLGANSTIIAGNSIGALSLIGAGSVVTKPVEPGSLVFGNPAVFRGWVDVSGLVISNDPDSRPQQIVDMLKDPSKAIYEFLNREN